MEVKLCNIVQTKLDPSDARPTGFSNWYTGEPIREILFCKTHQISLYFWEEVTKHKEQIAHEHQNQTN